MEKLYLIITSKNPLQLDFEFTLWTRATLYRITYALVPTLISSVAET